jgi:hypothetical protein
MAVDFRSLGKYEQGALISGALAIILSFFGSYVTASFDGPGAGAISNSAGTNAWTSYATLGILLVILATVIVAVKAFAAENLPEGVPWSLVAFAAAALGTLLLILRALFPGGPDFPGLDVGPGWSGYLLWIAGIALSVFTFLTFKASGETLPRRGAAAPAGPASAAPQAPQASPPPPPATPPARPAAEQPPTTPPAPPAAEQPPTPGDTPPGPPAPPAS